MERTQLADFLRVRRARLRPTDVGLPTGPRRRISGLRREEVAQLAAISVDYYTRLEQARGPRPSRQVCASLARALRLSDDERARLAQLVGLPAEAPGSPPSDVPAGILRLIDRLDDTPAFVIDAKYDLLAWNSLAIALLCDPLDWPAADRNLIWQLFGSPYADFADPDIDGHASLCVADLRTAAMRYPADPGIAALITRLRAISPEFVRRWTDYPVLPSRSTSTKRIPHPVVGELELDCEVLEIGGRDQRLILYTAAPGTRSHEALRLLAVVGTQQL